MTRYLTTPWRARYVRGAAGRTKGCVFCAAAGAPDDAAAFVVHRGRGAFVLLNAYPYTPGHLMIAPYAHIGDYEALPAGTAREMADLTRTAMGVLRRSHAPQGFNAGLNSGRVAGAGVVGHVHLHVVPRWAGDASFMPLVGDTRVFLEDLRTSYERIRPIFAGERPRPPRRA